MKRIYSIILSSLVFIFMFSISVSAEAEPNVLSAYQEVLDTFNKQYGMSARFPTESELSKMGLTIQDRNNFITAMTTDEYLEHLISNHPGIEDDYVAVPSSLGQTTSKTELSREITQKYAYDINDTGKYLYICITRSYVNGTCYYGSVYDSGCAFGNTYPYYVLDAYNPYSYSFESNYTKVSVTFNCARCTSPGVTYNGITVQCKFRATDNIIYDPQLYI